MKQISILFIDDDKFLLDMYSLKFLKKNYKVQTAQSSEEGLKAIKDGLEPDILLLDIVMTGISGIEMLSLIRKDNLIKDAVVIMLTNQGLPDDIAKAKKLNVDGYIIKATTIPSEVLNEVEKIFSAKKK